MNENQNNTIVFDEKVIEKFYQLLEEFKGLRRELNELNNDLIERREMEKYPDIYALKGKISEDDYKKKIQERILVERLYEGLVEEIRREEIKPYRGFLKSIEICRL